MSGQFRSCFGLISTALKDLARVKQKNKNQEERRKIIQVPIRGKECWRISGQQKRKNLWKLNNPN